MMENDYAYLYHRAETELKQAQQATHAKAVAAHHQLAEAYLERASSLATNNVTLRDGL